MTTSGGGVVAVTKPYRPSNGTEGMDFMAQFCDRCRRDANYDNGKGPGCQILAASMAYQFGESGYPPEWIEDEQGSRCTAFEPMYEDGGPIRDMRQAALL